MGTPGRKKIEGLISRRRERNGSREQAEGLSPEVQGKLSPVGNHWSVTPDTQRRTSTTTSRSLRQKQVTVGLRRHNPLGAANRPLHKQS